MPWIRTFDDVDLHYETYGEGEPILFIHGWAMDSKVWKYQLAELAKNNKIIILDLRGHGLSGKPDSDYNFNIFAEDLNTVIKALHLKNPTLVGWSMGVPVIVRFHSIYNEVPVKAFVFVSGTPKFLATGDFSYGAQSSIVQRFIKQFERDYQIAVKNFHNLMFYGEDISEESLKEIKRLLVDEVIKPPKHVLHHCLRVLADEDLREEISKVNIPTLVIHGSCDIVCPPPAGEFLARSIAGAELEMFQRVGHAPFLTQAGRFNDRLLKFLTNHRG